MLFVVQGLEENAFDVWQEVGDQLWVRQLC